MPSRLGSTSSRLAAAPTGEAGRSSFRRNLSPWRAWYGLARWKAKPHGLRWQVLVEAGFTCGICQQATRRPDASDMVADHIIPHRGDQDLFWSRANLQCLCKACHDGVKQAEERRGLSTAGFGSAPMARPDWFRPARLPLTIVVGPPGSGKSTYVRSNAGPRDLVVCFDQISKRIFGTGRLNVTSGDPRIGDILRARNEMLGEIMRANAPSMWPKAWLILTEPKAVHRQWWQERLRPSEIIVLATPAAECQRRCAADRDAGDKRRQGIDAVIAEWWSDYTPRPGEKVIA